MDWIEGRLRKAGWGRFVHEGRLVHMDARVWNAGWNSYPRTIEQAINWTPTWATEEHNRKRYLQNG